MDIEAVRKIVTQVLNERLGQGQSAVGSRQSSVGSPGSAVVNPQSAIPNPQSSTPRQVITAETIQQLGDGQKIIELPRSAIVTPLAKDYIAQRKITVNWTDVVTDCGCDEPSTAGARQQPGGQALSKIPKGPILVTYDDKTLAVQQLLAALTRETLPLTLMEDTAADADLPGRIRQLSEQIKSQSISAAIILVSEPEFALAYANKFTGVRAALAGDWKSIHRAAKLIGANVLVIDYPAKTFYQLLQLVRTFVRTQATTETCGEWQELLDGY